MVRLLDVPVSRSNARLDRRWTRRAPEARLTRVNRRKRETTMQQVVRAFPVLEGREAELGQFLDEIQNKRKADTDAFYKRYGVTRETAYLQRTEKATILIVVTDIDDADKRFADYGASRAEFEAWFKQRVEAFSGINLNDEPRGPVSKRLHDWSRDGKPLEE